MNSDQALYLLEMAYRDGSVDELKWRFPDVDWPTVELRLQEICAATEKLLSADIQQKARKQQEAITGILKVVYEPSLKSMLTESSGSEVPYELWYSAGTSTTAGT